MDGLEPEIVILTEENPMFVAIITAVAVLCVVTLYVWESFCWYTTPNEQNEVELEDIELQPIEGSDWELEYLMTTDYAR